MEELLDNIYNAFNGQPLQPGDPAYVDCQAVRGDVDILRTLGRSIRRSDNLTYQVYSGYRGAGKTTELLRLKDDLEKQNCFVVYFAADEDDISVQDTQYTDILLACTRHILTDLKEVDPTPVIDWLKKRWHDLKDFLHTEVKFDELSVELQLQQFTKLSTTIRAEPSQRQQIRQKVENHTETLIEALNQFIANAQKKLVGKKLVVIADNLDRIVFVTRDNGRSSHEEIFLDRHEQLKALKCHMIYTVPISMIYSKWGNELKDNYGLPQVLPSIMIQERNDSPYPPGIAKLAEALKVRIERFAQGLDLETEIFESKTVLDNLCFHSGGYMRDLILMMQDAVNRVDSLPIPAKAVQRTIAEFQSTYDKVVEENQWKALAKVHRTKQIDNDDLYRALLFNRCLLEYQKVDDDGKKEIWQDVHPLLRNAPKFQEALKNFNAQSNIP
jgi:uncharacterized protein YgiM (DUF1202 family)